MQDSLGNNHGRCSDGMAPIMNDLRDQSPLGPLLHTGNQTPQFMDMNSPDDSILSGDSLALTPPTKPPRGPW